MTGISSGDTIPNQTADSGHVPEIPDRVPGIGRRMSDEKKKIRVMVVEDSAYMRYVISEILTSAPDIEVIDKARDGIDALERLAKDVPDVITLDIQMPRMDGLTFLAEMRKNYRIPTVMLSSLSYEGASDTIRALELGAVDFVAKPSGMTALTLDDVREALLEKVRMAATIKPVVMQAAGAPHEEPGPTAEEGLAQTAAAAIPERRHKHVFLPDKIITLKKVVVIGCSTGGPRALTEIVPLFPEDFSACVIVVQHMPPRFTASLAERLNAVSGIRVAEAKNGDKVVPGVVYIAPGDYHILVGRGDTIYLNQDPPRHGVRPSVDVIMKSAAAMYGKKCVGVILTGMGSDGRDGIVDIKKAGGTVFAEHESTCVVYGMPRAAIETGSVDRVIVLPRIADELIQFVEN
jgi:two-component system, chemotaxis family, protein-glutamate methylesterase/glutaminase